MNETRLKSLINRYNALNAETERLVSYADSLGYDIKLKEDANINDKFLRANIRRWHHLCEQIKRNKKKLIALNYKIENERLF